MTSSISSPPTPHLPLFQTLLVKTHPSCAHVLHVSLHRPQKRNAMNSIMWSEIATLFSLIGTTGSSHRCVLLTGSGSAFCTGIDTGDPTMTDYILSDHDTARKILAFRPQITAMQEAFTALESCPLPVVAAVHGYCLGAGVDLISAADIRVCDSSAVFSIREVRVGLAADVGTLQRFPKIVGHGSRVRELCLTGADFGAKEAERIGFVSRVCDDVEIEALNICERIGDCSPVAVAVTKESLVYSRDHSVREGLDHIRNLNAGVLLTEDLFAGGAGGDFKPLMPHSRL